MDFNLMPNELLQCIISYLDIKAAKNISLTSKKMNSLTLERLWSKPRYSKPKDKDFLQKISRFPITELHVVDFDCNWIEVNFFVPQLKLLHIDNFRNQRRIETPMKSCLRFLKLPLSVHTNFFGLSNRRDFNQLLEILETVNVKELFIDHFDWDGSSQRPCPLDWFKTVASKFNIPQVMTICLGIYEQNVCDYIRSLTSIRYCRFLLHGHGSRYRFTVKDLELMVELDIRVVYVESRALNTDGEISKLLEFLDILRRMKYLEAFGFSLYDFEDQNPEMMEKLLVDLPIQRIGTQNFRLEEGNIEKAVQILSRMESLIELRIQPVFQRPYRLSPKEFLLFRNLPVTYVHLGALDLDLTKENVLKFRAIMKVMEIEEIGGFPEQYFDDDKDFEIFIEDFRYEDDDDDVFKTIGFKHRVHFNSD